MRKRPPATTARHACLAGAASGFGESILSYKYPRNIPYGFRVLGAEIPIFNPADLPRASPVDGELQSPSTKRIDPETARLEGEQPPLGLTALLILFTSTGTDLAGSAGVRFKDGVSLVAQLFGRPLNKRVNMLLLTVILGTLKLDDQKAASF